MKKNNPTKRKLELLFACFSVLLSTVLIAQPLTTTFTNNNGNSEITFNFQNTNAYDVQITEISSITGNSGANTGELWYKPTAIAGAPGAISAANGWTQVGTQAFTGVANTTTSTPQLMMSGLALIVPAGATYGITYACNNLRYSTLAAGTYTIPGGGCNLITGTNIGYGGALPPAVPANTPRGFIGSVNFIAAVPCAGTPDPGTALISTTSGCVGSSINLSATGVTASSGITYQWESSPDNLAWSPIVGATTANYSTTSLAGTTYYRIVTTCSNGGAINNSNSVSFVGTACTPTNIPATGSSIIACGTNTSLYDDGGPAGNYAVSASGYTVLQNSGTGIITLSGTYSGVETCCDNIRIYDGVGTGGTLLFTYGATGAGTITTFVSAPGQSITVQLNSDGSVQGAGFAFQAIYSGACAVCLGTPTAGATASVPASVNIGQSFTLSLAGAGIESGLTYQWQSSPDGISYTDILGATASTYTGTETASTYYQCIVTCTASGFSDTNSFASSF
ncbi:MAG: hypothetical protein IPH89_01040 [Bacteroidetes bacterium]|nr:hypothetical protein [Bacteroidota bacterium]